MVTLKNDFLTVEISQHGAEIQSIVDNHTQQEYVWQADPKVWKRHAPVLFPIVGALKDNQYEYAGKTYHMSQHGFARDRDFTVASATDRQAVFTLSDDEKTHENYPFAFKFTITISLDNNNVHVNYNVQNPSDTDDLLFSVGGHPGFQIPLTNDTKFEDYYMAFTPTKSRVQIPLVAGKGIDYAHRTLAATDVNQQLGHEFFKNDAMIYELKSPTKFALRSDKTKHGVELSVSDAPFLGVWSPYPTLGNFVCIEPWWGIADIIEFDGKFEDKLGINKLAPKGVFDHGFSIAIF